MIVVISLDFRRSVNRHSEPLSWQTLKWFLMTFVVTGTFKLITFDVLTSFEMFFDEVDFTHFWNFGMKYCVLIGWVEVKFFQVENIFLLHSFANLSDLHSHVQYAQNIFKRNLWLNSKFPLFKSTFYITLTLTAWVVNIHFKTKKHMETECVNLCIVH